MRNIGDERDVSETHMIAQIQQGYKVLAELQLCNETKSRGIYVIPSSENYLHWYGVLFTHSGVFADSALRFSILLPENFPDTRFLPDVIFQYDCLHPLINPFTNQLDLSFGFPEWQKGETHIWHILRYIQLVFIYPEESMNGANDAELNNPLAAHLIKANPDEYLRRIRQAIAESNELLFAEAPTRDPHYLVFERYQQDKHAAILEHIRKNKVDANFSGAFYNLIT